MKGVAAGDWDELQDLALKAQAGDAASYQIFLGRIAKVLKPRLYKVLPERHMEDALQETLMAIHKSLHTLDANKRIAPWVNAIAHYKIQDQLRYLYKNAVQTEYVDGEHSGSTSESTSELFVSELLSQLPARDREVLQLLKLEERSVQEVADKLQISVSNVKVITFRALQKLRVLLAKEEFHEDR